MMPSAETPALICAAADGRLPVIEMLFLAIEHQLDRRVRLLREPRADQPFGAELSGLLPKPPPMYWQMTRTLALRDAEAAARSCRARR